MAASTASRVNPKATRAGADRLQEALRWDRTPTVIQIPGQGATASRPLGMAYIEPSALPLQRL